MATKGLKNLIGNLTGNKKNNKSQHQQEQEKVTSERERERELRAILESIDLEAKSNKLSPEKVKEIGIASVIRHTLNELKYPLIVEQDLTDLDDSIKFCANELKRSVINGMENTAKWACVALIAATDTLRTEITGNDVEYAEALMASKLEYAKNLELLVKTSRELDDKTDALNRQQERYDRDNTILQAAIQEMQDKIDSGEYAAQINDIQRTANDPHAMTPAARKVRDELNDIHNRQASLKGLEVAINTLKEERAVFAATLEECRNRVAIYPRVTDPNLLAKNQEADKEYRENLRKRLNAAEEGMAALANHLSQMMDLGSHPLFIKKSAKAMDVVAELQMKRLREQQMAQEAEIAMARARETSVLLEQEHEKLKAELEAERERVQITEREPEQIFEQVFELEAAE